VKLTITIMKTNALLATRDYMFRRLGLIITFALSSLIVIGLSAALTQRASAQTFAAVTAQADFGSRGTNVSNIQRFLASTPSFYPEGLITGYFGSLTREAVKRFQAFYGIVSSGTAATTGYGRVGPSTMAKMNALIAAGGGTGGGSTSDIAAPYISSVQVTPSSTSATVTWFTNEASTDRLYFDTTPIRFNEGDINSNGFLVLTGQSGATSIDLATSHSGTMSGLSPNTTYYYLIVSKDIVGNVSVSLPGATFRTGM
jgi:peptidoglycan hydrolase-like protein with peptidoglycan-binding domain